MLPSLLSRHVICIFGNTSVVDIFVIKFARTGKKNSSDYEVVKEILTELELIVDSYEQPIDRPGEYQEQKKYVLAPVLWTINRKVPV
ncbi:hypothetical protein BCV63_15790 [Cylindrospermopsis raciborskii CS-508]|uniref:hypothetical protein n=1 Tax=Cylindrospermopsis raciborskii TaxID=77022 RepID=UPI0008DDF705|nr:hypothetical protein [Cylindrospermopsis raciborskii]OHY35598.1 hypothetical protein BCV63_15790 [Cylindrospermopsis raciborskii CS-508]